MLVGFDPASGHEQQGAGRPALVLSVQAFNQLGMTLVAPITQGGNFARYAGFSVPLHCEEGDVHGVVLVNQVRMMDLRARLAKRIGLAADEVVEEALLRRLQVEWFNDRVKMKPGGGMGVYLSGIKTLFSPGANGPKELPARRSGLLR